MRTSTLCIALVVLVLPYTTPSTAEGAATAEFVQKFEVTPSDTEVNPGEDVTLQCRVLNRRGDCVWLKDNLIIGRIPGKYNFEVEPEDGDCSLQIVNATLEKDDASWKCQVSKATRKGSPITSSAIKLIVLEQPRPPRLEDGSNRLQPGDTLKMEVGDIRDIRCVSRKGNPPALLRWLLDSKDISHLAQQTNHTDEENPRTWKAVSFLNYTFTEVDNRKQLQCVAYHSSYEKTAQKPEADQLGHRDVTITLDVMFPPRITRVDPPTTATFNVSKVVALNCEAEGNPVPEIKWLKQSEKDPNIWTAQGQKGKLTILHASYRDNGVYRCEATNTIWNRPHVDKSQEIRIDIRGPPELKAFPESGHVEVKKGEPFEIGCTASGNPNPVLTWRHMNDSSIDVNALVEKNVMRISSADHMHAGTYECTANNSYGEPAVRFISVKIIGKPTVKTTAQWTRGLDGSRNAQLLCEVYGANPGSTIWLRSGGSPLVQGKSLHLTVDGNNHTARLNSVSNLDYDNYTCVSQNEYGIAMSTVEISGKPTVKATMQWTRGLDGRPIAELVCIVDSANPFRTDWLQSYGTPLIESKSVNLFAAGNNFTAKLYNASEADYGNYTCVSQNKHGIAMSTVEISGRPTVKTTMQWIRGLDGSRSAELVCEVHSPNPSRTIWLRSGGSPLVHGESVHLHVDNNNHSAKVQQCERTGLRQLHLRLREQIRHFYEHCRGLRQANGESDRAVETWYGWEPRCRTCMHGKQRQPKPHGLASQ
uniref:Putative cell adhesion molecule n=1 Tax=Ixodes ricinus TaxID=34613 RepID=A0A090XDS0_IXORI